MHLRTVIHYELASSQNSLLYLSVSFFSHPLPEDCVAGCDDTGGCGDDTLPSCMFFSACSAPRGLVTLVSGWSIGCDVTAVTKVRQASV